MEKWLKLFLSALLVFSCNEKKIEQKSELNRELAELKFKEEHNFLQGSPQSMKLLEEAIELDSTYAEALREYSVANLKRGMPLEWKPKFDKAVYHDPKTWQGYRGYLYLWFYRDYKKAIADFDATDTLTPHLDYPQGHSVYFWRGIAYLGLKDYDNSIAYWDKHITKETEDTGEDWVELEAFLYRGIAYHESGNSEKALENFDKVIHYFKQSADAKYYKALVFMEQQKYEEALALVDEAILDFEQEFYNNRAYVETLRQIYRQDLEELRDAIVKGN
ncbi:tetratricopeptide repeat protein [Maribacter aestuarii]|uniref:tetratricopeptide repeat protein n=1 Tax=Maribacter aestuarii TaxID=1130723 RepID=UPI00248C6972|nr:tetratricopeptide repeat protein [Maribacter aestuarii]